MDKPQVKIRYWIFTIAIILALISGSFLLYKWWQTKQTAAQIQAKERTLNQLEQKQQAEREKAHQAYQIRHKQLPQVLALAKNPTIHQFFNDLLQGYAYRFAEKQNLTDYCLPLEFGGFYQQKQEATHNFRELGNAVFDLTSQETVISLNQLFLFNKLGYERYFATPELYLNIDFNTLTETISHELAHYFQFVKYGKSSCESSGQKASSGNFLYPDLVSEHTHFTQEIKQMIVNSSEYPTLKKYWKAIDVSS